MRISRLGSILSVLILMLYASPSSGAGDRLALVIGNAKYPDAEAPLREPINDARELADELKRDGFAVEIGENLTGEQMRRAFDRLYGKIKPGAVALLFFSGFGIESGRQSYMIPVDAQIWTAADVRRDGFSLETVLGEINSRGAGVKIALIDASRPNPFERRFRSFSAGLAPVDAPSGSLVMYSAALSSVAAKNGGDRGLFVRELLKEIREPGVAAEEALNRTRVAVTRASRNEQVPWISASLAETFTFNQAGNPSRPLPAPNPPAIQSSETTATPPPLIQPAAAPPPLTQPAAPPVPAGVNTPGRKVALVIGNSAYKSMPSLKNPKNDAVDVEAALKGLGFETVLATDLDRLGMNGAIDRYSRMVKGATVAMVYYSGHGMQFMGKNYLLPTDANLESAEDVNRYRLLPVDDLVELLGQSSGLQLIVLDACRNNPMERDFKNKVASVTGGNRDVASTRGFARLDTRSGLVVTYATAPNDVAADGTGRNSPFTAAFLKNVAAPDVEVIQMLFRVQREVFASSGSKQLPEISSLYVGPEIRLKSSK